MGGERRGNQARERKNHQGKRKKTKYKKKKLFQKRNTDIQNPRGSHRPPPKKLPSTPALPCKDRELRGRGKKKSPDNKTRHPGHRAHPTPPRPAQHQQGKGAPKRPLTCFVVSFPHPANTGGVWSRYSRGLEGGGKKTDRNKKKKAAGRRTKRAL